MALTTRTRAVRVLLDPTLARLSPSTRSFHRPASGNSPISSRTRRRRRRALTARRVRGSRRLCAGLSCTPRLTASVDGRPEPLDEPGRKPRRKPAGRSLLRRLRSRGRDSEFSGALPRAAPDHDPFADRCSGPRQTPSDCRWDLQSANASKLIGRIVVGHVAHVGAEHPIFHRVREIDVSGHNWIKIGRAPSSAVSAAARGRPTRCPWQREHPVRPTHAQMRAVHARAQPPRRLWHCQRAASSGARLAAD